MTYLHLVWHCVSLTYFPRLVVVVGVVVALAWLVLAGLELSVVLGTLLLLGRSHGAAVWQRTWLVVWLRFCAAVPL